MAATNVQAFSGDVDISSNLAVDTNTLFVDSVGNKVGIGLTNPAIYLHLSAKNSDPLATEGDYVGVHTLTEYLRFTSIADVGDVNNISVGFKLGGDDNDDTSPDGRLDICANEGSNAGNEFGKTPDRTIATFLGGGTVGIGTNAPTSRLTVASTIDALDATDSATFDKYTAVITNTMASGADDKEMGISFASFTGTTFPNTVRTPGAAITHERVGDWSKGKLHFKTKGNTNYDGNCSTRMTIDETGNVGIGTTNPDCLLHLSSATGSSSIVPTKLKIHTTTEASDWSITDPWGLIEFDINDTSFAGSGPVAGIGVRSGDTTGGYPQLCFYTDNNQSDDTALGSANERMVIDHDGNVGIGTANPLHALDVKRDITIGSSTITHLQTHFNIGNETISGRYARIAIFRMKCD